MIYTFFYEKVIPETPLTFYHKLSRISLAVFNIFIEFFYPQKNSLYHLDWILVFKMVSKLFSMFTNYFDGIGRIKCCSTAVIFINLLVKNLDYYELRKNIRVATIK